MSPNIGQGVWEVFEAIVRKLWCTHTQIIQGSFKHSDRQAVPAADSVAGLGEAQNLRIFQVLES